MEFDNFKMEGLNYKEIAKKINDLGKKGNTYGEIFEDL